VQGVRSESEDSLTLWSQTLSGAILFYMTIAKHWFTGIPVAIASGYIKLLERSFRRWQL